jgi:DNA uptake protein ComE-like DNA-binding protein
MRHGTFVAWVVVGSLLAAAGLAAQTPVVLLNHRRSGNFTFKTVDLNIASAADLTKLPGIDYWTAQRIISARPYRAAEEIATRGIISREVFAALRDRLVVVPQQPR